MSEIFLGATGTGLTTARFPRSRRSTGIQAALTSATVPTPNTLATTPTTPRIRPWTRHNQGAQVEYNLIVRRVDAMPIQRPLRFRSHNNATIGKRLMASFDALITQIRIATVRGRAVTAQSTCQ